ncbi:L,D-transpeptidase family protein [Actinacidiphila bryophytorum]|uniref:L,D-peptidoglycan transpeptidase YkuD, ErfK/YbiS/YcfS/YnhG family n=1 Tax=Actinacidiphila bryophytorum TaxID=1436133 RepID=A0A9W4H333_9ACTN|nr:L,D-transpeptidase family protein [Actinacidiphila bryophytorum]MBM9438109.1 L,D-transpeptidase family protein [Actinacidiphila bryophytorum]MBN6543626.1 L,D-transpeptidase family protein [Actinacidiphila bryophytorum]CAG7647397.1 L,D-peptidoglycan transpeptidase YkuD, ErfK/YbiS/YcfS/YnhG family [Actinacidiphila bryophytorum]
MPSPTPRALLTGLGAAAFAVLAGCTPHLGSAAQHRAAAPAVADDLPPGPAATTAQAPTVTTAPPRQLAGVGPQTLARIPQQTSQVVLVTGRSRDSSDATVVLYLRTADGGWQPGAAWPAHNAKDGWTDDHHGGDLRSPIGVFTLSDAGGLRADPGSKLPYHHSRGFHVGGRGFRGEPLAGSFDYVVAIDYNRKTGVSPLDWTRPMGESRGGGIWLHVDHGGPTHGCVSVSETHMKQLLATLDPALHPVVVMGDAASLSR